MTVFLGAVCALLLGQFLVLAANLLYWRKRRPTADGTEMVISVLIPARNERDTLPKALRALAEQTQPPFEIIVCDDGSEDGTRQWLAEHAAELRVEWFESAERPEGWVGKTWACHQLGRRAQGDWLLFLDADTAPGPGFVELIARVCADTDACLVTALPRLPGGPGDALIVGMFPFSVMTTLPLTLAENHPNPGFAFANGQALAFRRDDYLTLLPHERTKLAFVEDMQIAMMVKRMGGRARIADARRDLAVRVYHGFRDAVDGFTKNAAELSRGPGRAVGMVSLVAVLYLVPLAVALTGNSLAWVPVGISAVLFGAVWGLFGMSPLWGLLYPLAVLLTAGILLRSALWRVTGRVRWKGRSYSLRGADGA